MEVELEKAWRRRRPENALLLLLVLVLVFVFGDEDEELEFGTSHSIFILFSNESESIESVACIIANR